MKRGNGNFKANGGEKRTDYVVKKVKYDLRKSWECNVSDQFPIASIEVNDGKAIAKVDYPHSGFCIESYMSNEKLNGKADIYSDMNILVASLEYVDGIANGPCTLYDEMGRLFFKGTFHNGMRQWRGKEYDCEGNEVFDGFFEKGKKLSIFKIDRNKEYWKEVDKSNLVKCISERDEHGTKKGICYFYNKGKINRISKWKNGEEIRLIKVFRDSEMIEYGDTQDTVKYIGEFLDSFELNYPREGYGIEYDTKTRSTIYQGYFFNNQRHGKGKSFCKGKIQFDGIWNNGMKEWQYYIRNLIEIVLFYILIFKLWSVSLLFNGLIILYCCKRITHILLPQYGFKHLVVQDAKSLDQFDVGVSDLEVMPATCNNVNQIDLHNMIQLKTIDIGGESFQSMISFQLDGQRTIQLLIVNYSTFDCQLILVSTLIFSYFREKYNVYSRLSRIDIFIVLGLFLFLLFYGIVANNPKAFKIDGLARLKSIRIGDHSFIQPSNFHYIKAPLSRNSLDSLDTLDSLSKRVRATKSFHVVNCYSLESIEIGEYSFSSFTGIFELKNLPNLQTIKIGTIGRQSNNFSSTSFEIRGIWNILYGNP